MADVVSFDSSSPRRSSAPPSPPVPSNTQHELRLFMNDLQVIVGNRPAAWRVLCAIAHNFAEMIRRTLPRHTHGG